MAWFRRRRQIRAWFRDKDGTFYRNANLVSAEMAKMPKRTAADFRRLDEMHAEWDRIFRKGVDRNAELGPDDIELTPRPMREAYPQYPILWTLDDADNADHH